MRLREWMLGVVMTCGASACVDDAETEAQQDALVDAGPPASDAGPASDAPSVTDRSEPSVDTSESVSIYICSLLSADECEAASDCTKLSGQQVDAFSQCVSPIVEEVGCVSRVRSCPATPTLATDEFGAGWQLTTPCMPRGWRRPSSYFFVDETLYQGTLPPSWQRLCLGSDAGPYNGPSDAGASDAGF